MQSTTIEQKPVVQQKTKILYEVNWNTLVTSSDTEESATESNQQCDGLRSPTENEFEIIGDEEAFSAPSQAINAPPSGKVDHIPVVSQVKSIIYLAAGNEIAAKQAQENFSKGAVGVSQVRSIVEYAAGDVEAAKETQEYFWNHSRFRDIDKTPVVGHVKGGIHYLLGDKEKGADIFKKSTDVIMNSSLFGRLRRFSSSDSEPIDNSDNRATRVTGPRALEENSDSSDYLEAMDMEEEEKCMEYNKCRLELNPSYLPD